MEGGISVNNTLGMRIGCIRILFVVLGLLAAARSDAAWRPVALTDSLGLVVDSLEQKEYGLFPDVEDFRSARALTNGSGYRIEVTRGSDGRTSRTKLSKEAFESTRLHARTVERYRSLESTAPTSEDELQYLLALRFAAATRYAESRALLQDLAERTAGTPLGDAAAATRNDMDRILLSSRGLYQPHATRDQSGKTDLLTFAGAYGIWTGVAIPIWMEDPDTKTFAAGFLVAPPLALVIASSASKNAEMGIGRAHMIALGGWLGTTQGAGWAALSDMDGNEAVGVSVVSGLAGIAAASALTSKVHFSEGHGTLTNNAHLWGAWFGLVGGVVAGVENEGLLRASLIGSDAMVLGTAIAARNVRMSKNRARLISLLGVVGTTFGLGIDLMAEVPNAETALAIAGIGSVTGLAVGATLTQNYDDGKDLSLETTRTEETRWSFAPKAVRDPETGRTVPGMGVRVSF